MCYVQEDFDCSALRIKHHVPSKGWEWLTQRQGVRADTTWRLSYTEPRTKWATTLASEGTLS